MAVGNAELKVAEKPSGGSIGQSGGGERLTLVGGGESGGKEVNCLLVFLATKKLVILLDFLIRLSISETDRTLSEVILANVL